MAVADVDVCSSGQHDCEQLCINTEGGYQCGCEPHYELQPDQRSCAMEDDEEEECVACDEYGNPLTARRLRRTRRLKFGSTVIVCCP